MKVAFHQIAVEIPLTHVIRMETLEFSAVFHNHAVVHLKLLLEDGFQNEEIESLEGGAALTLLWEDAVIFEGLVTSASLLREKALTYLYLSASSYTLQWDFIRRSHSYGNEAMTYQELVQQVVNRYDHSSVIDCIAGEQKIPGFLLQYEETDWVFLQRLASHFGTFLVPDYKSRAGRIYFGLPKEREPVTVNREDYVMNRNMETFYKLSGNDQFLPQEASKWQINCQQLFELGDELFFNEVKGVVTAIHYQLSDGELIFTYEVSRKSGLVCFYQSNPRIYGMSLPGIVKNRSQNQIRVHLEIDETYTETGDTHWFTYAIESSGIRSLPQIGSKVHIYFPGHIEQEAFAVHAVRLDAGEKSRTKYMPAPSYKSFSDVNGSQIYLAESGSGLIAGAGDATHIILNDAGEMEVKGNNIQLLSTDIVIGGTLCPQYLVARGSNVLLGLCNGTEQGFIINKNLGISARILSVDAYGFGYIELKEAAETFIAEVTKNDETNRDEINRKAKEAILKRIADAREQRTNGILMVVGGATTILLTVFFPPVTGILATKTGLAIIYAGSTAYIVVGLAEEQEGRTDIGKLMDGDLSGGDNFIKDVTGEELYDLIKASVTAVYMVTSATLATGIMSTMADALTACGATKGAYIALHMGKNVGRAMVHDFFVNGSVDLNNILTQAALGYVQGTAGGFLGNMAGKYLGDALGGSTGAYLIGEVLGTTGVDVAMDWGYAMMNDQEFDWASSIWLNLLANGVATLIQEPVDAASGGYYINSEDLIISGICNPIELRRRYLSVNRGSGSMGKGWTFSYDSRLRFDQEKLHLDVPTGHRLLFSPVRAETGEQQWQLESKGCGWFSLREEPETNCFTLYDCKNHVTYHYDKNGLLIEESTSPQNWKRFYYDEQQHLRTICFPGDYRIEIEWQAERITEIKDWTGRTVRYGYRGDYLTRVEHVDQGVCTYRYGRTGYLEEITNQTGQVYMTNQYDPDGRIVQQELANGEYYTMSHDLRNGQVTSYYSGRNSTEIYHYNRDGLITQAEYNDKTTEFFEYNEQQYRIRQIDRRGIETGWEYDSAGRIVKEQHCDGYEKQWCYDEKDNLVCERDNRQRETCYAYDDCHNRIRQVVTVSEQHSQITEWQYDDYGRCILCRDANGGETRYQYQGILSGAVSVINPLGEETLYEYDSIGRCVTVKNSYGFVSYGYTNRNYRSSYQNGEGEERRYLYDPMGRLYAYYPPRSWEEQSHAYEYRHDFMARETEMITPEGACYERVLNGEGDVLKEIHPNAQPGDVQEQPGIVYEYDGDANPIRIHYPDGGCERRFYDGAGNLIKKVEPEYYQPDLDDGAGYQYHYNAGNHLLQEVNPSGDVVVCYEYDVYGSLIREWDELGKDIRYVYDGAGNRTEMWEKTEDTRYRCVFYEYDNCNNKIKERYGQELTQLWEAPAACHELLFSYDANHHLTQVTDGFGACIRYTYDCLGNVVTEQKKISGDLPEQEIWQKIWYRYDKAGRKVEKKERIEGNGDPAFAITRYQYDHNGNLSEIITPNGHRMIREYDYCDRLICERTIDRQAGIDRSLHFAYDHAGNVIRVTQQGKDGEALTLTFQYDWKNRLIEKETPDHGSWQYQYDTNDRITGEQFDHQPLRCQTYDRQGNRITLKNGLNQLVQAMSYDSAGRLRNQQDAGQAAMEFAYTADGRQKQISRDGYALQQYEYQGQGHLRKAVDGNRNQTHFETDGWGRITKLIHADGSEEAYAYNAAGLITDTVDGNGNRITYQYNSLGKVSVITDQLGESEYFYYDKEGNLESTIDRNGNRVTTTYSVDGNILSQRSVKPGEKGAIVNCYDYDSLGRLKRAVSDGMCYTYEYTPEGRLQCKRSGGKNLAAYTYHRDGQMATLTDVTGKTVFYEYDSLRRLKALRDEQANELVSYEYDAGDRLIKTQYGTDITTWYEYDDTGKVSRIVTKSDDVVFFDYCYRYDHNGNRTDKTGSKWMMDGHRQESICFKYDRKNQLVEERYGDETIRYHYDPAGNRIRQERNQETFDFTYNEKNQLMSRIGNQGTRFYTYDKQGSLLEERNGDESKRYYYDSLNRQQEVMRADGTFQRNRYDAEGLRAEMEENGRLCRFIFHRGEIISEEASGENGSYLSSRYIRGNGVEYLEQDGTAYSFQKDEQGSTVFLLDREKEITGSYTYDGFGNLRKNAVSGKHGNRILYTGQQYDGWAEQYYLRARYYNPMIGRFTQEDVYRGDGLNLYAYCANNPVMYYDPSGYNADDCLELGFKEGRSELLPGEGDIGTYRDLLDAGSKGDNLTPHHMPSAEKMKEYGVSKNDGLSMNMEQPTKGGRHRQTDTYGRNMTDAEKAYYYSLSPRDALAYDLYNAREIYQSQGLYGEMRSKLSDYAKEYVTYKPEIFGKGVY